QVENHEIRQLSRGYVQCLHAARGGQHTVASSIEMHPHQAHHQVVVVHNQDAVAPRTHRIAPSSRGAAGASVAMASTGTPRRGGGAAAAEPYRAGASPSGSAIPSAGSVKLNLLPLPGALSTQMRPPCASTSRLQRNSPSPIPRGAPLSASAAR